MSRALLCESVTGRSMAELLAARDAVAAADMVELRLDGTTGVDLAAALAQRARPVVVTCRPVWEGGHFDGCEEQRIGLLREALELGAEFVDIEFAALSGPFGAAASELVRRGGRRIVLSSHDFTGVPADLPARAAEMRATGAGVIKIAVTAARLADTLPLLEIGREGDAVVIGMGDSGVPTRLLATQFGSRWTYSGHGVAPGQMPAARMVDEFGFRRVGRATRVYGVISTSAMHSLSPVMHNAAFADGGVDAVYVPLQTADFEDFLTFAHGLPVQGASVTIPFKVDALCAAGAADDLTRQVGAANTLRRAPGPATPGRWRDGWEATNTDVAGFLAPLDAAFGRPLKGIRAAVMGGGGSARAVVVALTSRGARVRVHARRLEQAQQVAEPLGAEVGPWPVPGGSWDLLVNTTPLGGAGLRDQSPLPGGHFTGRLVYDLTYGLGESALLREAREAGCATLDGLPMLIAQAERQFEWWTGQTPASGVMRAAAGGRMGHEAKRCR